MNSVNFQLIGVLSPLIVILFHFILAKFFLMSLHLFFHVFLVRITESF